jgi:hypothetical protein
VTHLATPAFWAAYPALPDTVRALADKNFALLKSDPRHPSLHLKRVGSYWSVRIGLRYRALAKERREGLVWFWVGTHDRYDQLVGS